MLRLRNFAGVAGGDGEEGISTIGDDEEAAAMACVARAIGLTADNMEVGAGSHTPLSGRVAHLGPRADQSLGCARDLLVRSSPVTKASP